jgi:hypothetical protein
MGRIRRRHHTGVVLVLVVLVAACSGDASGPTGPQVSVCHVAGSVGTVTDIFLSELASHKSHGDYVTSLEVDPKNTSADSIHFSRITDALAVARDGRIARAELAQAACRITITVAPGSLPGSTAVSSDPAFERFPFVIDVPDITVKGALKMQLDAAGRATGLGEGGDATTFAPNPALVVPTGGSQAGSSEPIFIVNAHPTGSKGDGAVIEGFVFRSGRDSIVTVNGGQGVLSMRVRGLVVRGNKFENGFSESVDLRGSSAIVERNHFSGRANACDICISGSGNYTVRDNRLLGPGGLPGILSTPLTILPVPTVVEQLTLPATALITGVISNNEVRGHVSKTVGAGIRLGGIALGAQDIINVSQLVVTGNNLVGNTFGMIIDAAFPVAGSALRADIQANINGNTISGSCQNDLLISFTRHQSGLGLVSPYPSYLRNSTYNLGLGSEFPLEKAWVANPPGFGNKLIVNEETMPNLTRTAYDATRVCP